MTWQKRLLWIIVVGFTAGAALIYMRPNDPCDEETIFALNPVNREIAGTAVILESYGRNEATLKQGDMLCIKFEWSVGVDQPAMNTLRIDLRNTSETFTSTEDGITWQGESTTTLHAIPIPRNASGSLIVTITPLSGDTIIGEPLDVTSITVNP